MWLPVTKGLHTAFEAHNSNRKIRFFRSLIHQPPDTVVGDEVHQDFFADHLRRSAAQDIQAHGRLDVAKKQLDIPPFEIKLGKLLRRISLGIKQGGDDVKPLYSESRMFHRDFDLPQDKLLRKLLPCVFRIRQNGVIAGAFPRYQQVIRPELFEAAC